MRSAAVAALSVSVILGAVNNLLFLAAFRFRGDWFADPAPVGGRAAVRLRRGFEGG